MLSESILPVVQAIRGMEEEDCVPLSFPYPSPTTNDNADNDGGNDNDEGNNDNNSDDNENNNSRKENGDNSDRYKLSSEFTTNESFKSKRKYGGIKRRKKQDEEEGTDSCNSKKTGIKNVPKSSASQYGCDNSGTSAAAIAALKWRTEVHQW